MTRFLAVLVFLAACKGTPTEVVDSDEPTPTLPATATVDADADGYTASIDCDDDNPAVNPGATERCNGIDDDCNDQIDDDPIDGNTAYADGDGDGYGDATSGLAVCGTIPAGFITVGGDCDDTDAHVNPGATEACDDTDADCDGTPGYLDSDAPGELTYYLDADADGYGDDANPVVTCAPPVGYVLTSGDCDDTRATVYPGRAEACDNYDNDCNGSVDDGLEATFYLDADSDGYGDPTTVYEGCEAPVGYVSDATDCDDTRSFVRPGAPELCDTYDNDCDASIDDADPEGPTNPGSWYADLDGDGYGVGDPTVACEQPADTAPASGDCNDDDATIRPGAPEVCDSIDNDCDTYADDEDPEGVDDTENTFRFYADEDLDGYGDPDDYIDACLPPLDRVANPDDCDDTLDTVNPDAIEVCNAGIDDNCDGVIDDHDPNVVLGTWYHDWDADGYGRTNPPPTIACEQPPNTAPNGDDCDDANNAINPGQPEICDTLDNDCDTYVDDADDDLDAPLYYVDGDLDGYGAEPGTAACVQPVDTITTGGDCDDDNDAIRPGADEICDTYDNDCDTYIDDADDDVLGVLSLYADADADGYGYGEAVYRCEPGPGYVVDGTDCDDTRDYVYPGAAELCDTYDNDCDTYVDDEDDDVVGGLAAYTDADGDGYGDDSLPPELVCVIDPPYVATGFDCDDTNPLFNPGAFDWGDTYDNDCDAAIDEDVGEETYDSADVQAIWNTRCGSCHLTGSAGGLNLVDGYASTVRVYSTDVPTMYQITPGSPLDSYIWAALTNTRGQVGGAGGIMPPGGPLTPTQLEVVETWILQGAVE